MKNTTTLDESDLEESFGPSSGPGGQHVNKTSTRVTLRHRPTNLCVTIQESRSQAANRQLARQRLLALIQQRERAAVTLARQAQEKIRRRNSPRPHRIKRRLLESKRHRSAIKQHRGRVSADD